jgi:hypothetical protein
MKIHVVYIKTTHKIDFRKIKRLDFHDMSFVKALDYIWKVAYA